MCPLMWAHWRHLVNTIEPVLPSVHQSPQPKWQIGSAVFAQLAAQCHRACWACPSPLKIVSSHGGSVPHLIRGSLGHPTQHHKRRLDQFSRFCTAHDRKSLHFTMGAPFPKIAPYHVGSGPLSNNDSLGSSKHTTQRASRLVQLFCIDDRRVSLSSYINNWKRLSVPCYFLVPCDKRKHTAHAHQQAASQARTDSAWRHPVWLTHSSLSFQRPVGRRSYRLTPQATITHSTTVACTLQWDPLKIAHSHGGSGPLI